MAESATLDVDAGNSRIKWRMDRDGLITHGAFAHLGRIETLNQLPMASLQRVRVASVASLGRPKALRDALQNRYGVIPVFAKTAKACGGVTCGYAEPSRLGVDRWLAIVAARRLTPNAFVVADLGTAVTLDFVDAAGQHLGGYIVPGLQSMVDALFRRTKQVHVSFDCPDRLQPGLNTSDAVNRGLLSMVLDFIQSSVDRFERTHPADGVDLFVSGGDAEVVAPLVQRAHLVVPDLVLDGLSIALP
jgi:type III pantothenate kinase